MTIDEMLGEISRGKKSQPHVSPVTELNLGTAKEIAYCIETIAERMKIKVVVSVVDKGANLLLLHSMDDAYIASVKLSQKKAYTSAALKMPTHKVLEESRGKSLDGLTESDGLIFLGGGYPLEADGKFYGAVGVSGGTKDEDALLAKAGHDYFYDRVKGR